MKITHKNVCGIQMKNSVFETLIDRFYETFV